MIYKHITVIYNPALNWLGRKSLINVWTDIYASKRFDNLRNSRLDLRTFLGTLTHLINIPEIITYNTGLYLERNKRNDFYLHPQKDIENNLLPVDCLSIHGLIYAYLREANIIKGLKLYTGVVADCNSHYYGIIHCYGAYLLNNNNETLIDLRRRSCGIDISPRDFAPRLCNVKKHDNLDSVINAFANHDFILQERVFI